MINTNAFFDVVAEKATHWPWTTVAAVGHGYVKSVFIVHVGGTRCVTSRTNNIMKIQARITLKVEVIRGYIFIFLFYV